MATQGTTGCMAYCTNNTLGDQLNVLAYHSICKFVLTSGAMYGIILWSPGTEQLKPPPHDQLPRPRIDRNGMEIAATTAGVPDGINI